MAKQQAIILFIVSYLVFPHFLPIIMLIDKLLGLTLNYFPFVKRLEPGIKEDFSEERNFI